MIELENRKRKIIAIGQRKIKNQSQANNDSDECYQDFIYQEDNQISQTPQKRLQQYTIEEELQPKKLQGPFQDIIPEFKLINDIPYIDVNPQGYEETMLPSYLNNQIQRDEYQMENFEDNQQNNQIEIDSITEYRAIQVNEIDYLKISNYSHTNHKLNQEKLIPNKKQTNYGIFKKQIMKSS